MMAYLACSSAPASASLSFFLETSASRIEKKAAFSFSSSWSTRARRSMNAVSKCTYIKVFIEIALKHNALK
jgi:hypothetical protein